MLRKLWKLLGSIRLAIILLIVLTVVSVIGIVIPQGLPEQQYIHKWGEGMGSVLLSLGINRMFSTYWFYGLLIVLALNVLVCSISRLLKNIASAMRFTFLSSSQALTKFKHHASFAAKGSAGETADSLRGFLRRRLFATRSSGEGEPIQIAASKGRTKEIGSLIFHFSLILLLVAGLIGRIGGYSYQQQLRKGQTAPVKDRSFLVRCNWFKLEKTAQGAIKDYKSKLTLLEPDGSKILDKVIEVNDPLSYEGIRFYQSSYGELSDSLDSIQVIVKGPQFGTPGRVITVAHNRPTAIPGSELTLHLTHFLPDFVIDMQTRQAYSRSRQHNNPAVKAVLTHGADTVYNSWVFQRFPNMHEEDGEYKVILGEYTPRYYTGIQIRKNPGVPLIWVGIVLMTISLLMVFYSRKRRLWIFISPSEKGGTEVSVGGTASNQAAFAHDFESLVEGMKKNVGLE